MKFDPLSKTGSIFLTAVMVAAIVAVPAVDVKAAGDIALDTEHFPDDIFRGYLSQEFDKDHDNSLSEKEIKHVREIFIIDTSLSDMTGIEYFTSLEELYCYRNQIKTLDLSNNTELDIVSCFDNQLSELNVNGCTKLRKLYCDNNKLTSLDLSTNTAMECVECYANDVKLLNIIYCPRLLCAYNGNRAETKENGTDIIRYIDPEDTDYLLKIDTYVKLLTGNVDIDEKNFPDENFRNYVKNTLDTSGDGKLIPDEIKQVTKIVVSGYDIKDLTGIEYFTYLTCLECACNDLTSLDVSLNTDLEELYCYSNKFTGLNVSDNPELRVLYCNQNALSDLDISKNSKLNELCCYGNKIDVLDIRNSDDLVNYFKEAPNLETRSDYKVANYSSGKLVVDRKTEIRLKDPEAGSVLINVTNFPDDCFRKYVSYVCDIDKDNQLSPSEIELVTKMDVGGSGISDLKGIEFFKYLEFLNCAANDLTSLDVSKNTKLTQLSCSQNGITALPLEKNTELISLICNNNSLTTLDVSHCKELQSLTCYFNSLTTLDLSNNTNLLTLDCAVNELTDINVSKNTQLTVLSCAFNKVKTLDLGNNTALKRLDCSVNEITALNVSKNPSLEYLTCSENNLTTLDVSKNTLLLQLLCGGNKLTNLDLSKNSKLYELYCYSNQLTQLDLTNNPDMQCLHCYKNQIKTLDISKCPLLIKAYNGNKHVGGELDADSIIYEVSSPESCEMAVSKTTEILTSTPTKAPSKPTATPVVTKEPVVTKTPSVTKAPTVTKAPAVTDSPAKTDDSKTQILSFVERIYKYVLDREPEAEGAAFWTDELYSFRRTGAEVGLGFIFSDEFVNRNLSDEDFVTVLYNTFFGREPEEGGFKFWTGALADGTLDRASVASGFIYSQEWADTCASYGIRSGGDIAPSVNIEPTEATYAFVERMYTTAMKRASDEEGAKFWAGELANFRFTGEQVGVMFFLSDEMQGFNLDNKEFVTRLYKTFMDREPEEGGFNFWVGYLADGGSREGAVLGFTRSEEFVNKCVEARILPY